MIPAHSGVHRLGALRVRAPRMCVLRTRATCDVCVACVCRTCVRVRCSCRALCVGVHRHKMLFKGGVVPCHDRSGVARCRIFQLYRPHWARRAAAAGTYIKGAVTALSRLPPRIRGRRYRPIRHGHIARMFIPAHAVHSWRVGCSVGCGLGFGQHGGFVMKRRGLPRSKHI